MAARRKQSRSRSQRWSPQFLPGGSFNSAFKPLGQMLVLGGTAIIGMGILRTLSNN